MRQASGAAFDLMVTAAYNFTANSLDGEATLAPHPFMKAIVIVEPR